MASITKEKKVELISAFGENAADTGNIRAQVAIITERIRNLTEHLKVHKKDKHTLKGLTSLVSQRRRLLKYYAEKDIEGYRSLIKELGLRR
ncbi:MAG: 30S ribosomal protein S15 [Fibrobacter sp.]|nr:30S ribosomal protein S15 [Fibrobacter sp.]